MIVNCKFLYKTRSKELQQKEYAMNNNITCDHTPFAQARMLERSRLQTCTHSRSRVFDLLSCMYVQRSIVKNESSSILQANCRPANHPAKCNWLEQYGILLIAHPTFSLTSHTSIAKIEGVAFSFGNLQSLELQSGLYSTFAIV